MINCGHMRNISSIFVHITPGLWYAILFGIPDATLNAYQHIQNICAKLVLNMRKYDNNSEALNRLHIGCPLS